MNFESALKAMREGKKVKRGRFVYFMRGRTFIWISGEVEVNSDCPFFQSDISAEDWEVIEDDRG